MRTVNFTQKYSLFEFSGAFPYPFSDYDIYLDYVAGVNSNKSGFNVYQPGYPSPITNFQPASGYIVIKTPGLTFSMVLPDVVKPDVLKFKRRYNIFTYPYSIPLDFSKYGDYIESVLITNANGTGFISYAPGYSAPFTRFEPGSSYLLVAYGDFDMENPEPSPTPTGTPEPTPNQTPTQTPTTTSQATPTPTPTPGTTPAATPQATSTATPPVTPSMTGSPGATPQNTPTRTPTPTGTPVQTSTPTQTRTPTSTGTPVQTFTPTQTRTPTPTTTTTLTMTPTPSVTMTKTPTMTPSVTPTGTPVSTPTPTPTSAPPPGFYKKAIFGYGLWASLTNMTSTFNLVTNTGVVGSDVTGVGTPRYDLAAASYGTDKAIFGYGGVSQHVVASGKVSMTNLVTNTGVVGNDVTGVGTARYQLAAAGYGTDKAIFGYGYIPAWVSMTNLVTNTGVVGSDVTGVGTARHGLAAVGYGTDKAIFGYGYGVGPSGTNGSMTNLVTNTGVVGSDVTGVGTARTGLAAASYGTDKAIFGYGFIDGFSGIDVSMTNLVTNTGVVGSDVTGVGTARAGLAAAGYGTDKAIFGYGYRSTATYFARTNLVTNTGVVGSDEPTVGLARTGLAAAGYG